MALERTAIFPLVVLGPVDFKAFRRFASRFFNETVFRSFMLCPAVTLIQPYATAVTISVFDAGVSESVAQWG